MRTENRITVLIAAIAVFAIATTACSSGDDMPATPTPTAVSAITAAVATSVVEPPTPVPLKELVVTEMKPEPGSDEALILAQFEKQFRAINDEDFERFTEICAPSNRKQLNDKQAAVIFEELWSGEGREKPHGYHGRNIEIEMLRPPFAKMEFDLFYYDTFDGSLFWTWEKVDDDWYLEVWPCL